MWVQGGGCEAAHGRCMHGWVPFDQPQSGAEASTQVNHPRTLLVPRNETAAQQENTAEFARLWGDAAEDIPRPAYLRTAVQSCHLWRFRDRAQLKISTVIAQWLNETFNKAQVVVVVEWLQEQILQLEFQYEVALDLGSRRPEVHHCKTIIRLDLNRLPSEINNKRQVADPED